MWKTRAKLWIGRVELWITRAIIPTASTNARKTSARARFFFIARGKCYNQHLRAPLRAPLDSRHKSFRRQLRAVIFARLF